MAIRDPLGYMPLSVGKNEEGFFVASESVAFGSKYLNAASRSVEPGELVIIDKNGMESHQLFERKEKQFCMFQFVYMCRPESVVEGKNVHTVRKRLGAEIAKHYRPEVDMLVPIMESGFSVTMGASQETGIPMDMGVAKDRNVTGRSFMDNEQQSREKIVKKKLNVIPEVVRGKSVWMLDDSLVRGTTMAGLVREVREAESKEIYLALSCPPIVSPCIYGIDFYKEQLIARPLIGKDPEMIDKAVGEKIGVDGLYYQRIDGLVEAIGLPKEQLCLSCLTGVYKQPVIFKSEEERKS
jgi:amidophosphoribosyltransferase